MFFMVKAVTYPTLMTDPEAVSLSHVLSAAGVDPTLPRCGTDSAPSVLSVRRVGPDATALRY
jgi:hypothetical protein